MLTALGLTFLLWQPDPTCIGCGGGSMVGVYPEGHVQRTLSRIWNYCSGDVWGFQATKCACSLGASQPAGDYWSFQMHGGMPAAPPVSRPVITPAPAPAPAPTPGTETTPATPPAAEPNAETAPAPTPELTPPTFPEPPLP